MELWEKEDQEITSMAYRKTSGYFGVLNTELTRSAVGIKKAKHYQNSKEQTPEGNLFDVIPGRNWINSINQAGIVWFFQLQTLTKSYHQ